MDDNWRTVIVSLIAAIPASIAAVSSLRNGNKLDSAKKKLEELQQPSPIAGVSAPEKEPARDWYSPPDLD